jgi:hypothetical protein
MSTLNVNKIADASGGVLAPISSVMRNRIINGAMVIDQRNAGASGTASGYTIDRWNYLPTQSSKGTWQQNAGSVTPPVGFTNYLGFTSSSAYSVITGDTFLFYQPIEGYNVADLGWGTANAKTITISFWVRSSLTGTFGGALINSAENRSYPFSYTISSANTWEYETITIAGDTSGTWLTNNGQGIVVRFGLGSGATYSGTAGAWVAGNIVQPTGSVSIVGTNGATFYITGVQLEVGTQATSFEYRQYGTELALCQRYYYKIQANASGYLFGTGFNSSTTVARAYIPFPVNFRTEATALEQSGTAADYQVFHGASTQTACSAVPAFSSATLNAGAVNFTVASGLTAGQGSFIRSNSTSGYLGFSAEL